MNHHQRASSTFLLRATLPILLLLGATGCGHLVKEVPKAAVPGVIEGGLKGMDDAENQRRLAKILASPEIKVIQKEMVADLLDGSLAALGEPERVARVGDVTSRYAASLLHGFSVQVAPELAAVTTNTMRGMMGGALSPENQREMQRLMGSVVQASFEPVMKSLSEAELGNALSGALTKQLGPAMRQMMREDLGPGIAESLSTPEVKRALGDMAHVLGREMVLGVNEGMAATQEGRSSKSSDPSLLASAGTLAKDGVTAARLLPFLLLAIVIGLGLWVWRLKGQTRQYRTETERRAETTRALTEALRAAEGKPWSGELCTALEDRFRDDEDALLRIRAARLGHLRRPANRISSNGMNGASKGA
jgi:hypothetical protein